MKDELSSKLRNSENVRKLVANTGRCVIVEDHTNATLLQADEGELKELMQCALEERRRPADDALIELDDIRLESKRKLEHLRKNPIREEYKWWSTGALMNRGQIEGRRIVMGELTAKIKNIEDTLNQVIEGTYTIIRCNDPESPLYFE